MIDLIERMFEEILSLPCLDSSTNYTKRGQICTEFIEYNCERLVWENEKS